MTTDLDYALACIRDLLPLAERYLSGAPTDPDHAKLETARALLKGHTTVYGLTAQERKALRLAATEALAGMFQGNRAALKRALERL